jgi:phosphatidylserine decarboxylase
LSSLSLLTLHQIRVGMSVGHSPNEPQWTPDMRKSDVTEAEKQDAKRRIQGNVNAEESPDDSGGDDIIASALDTPTPTA